ncbi:MAG: hypothetical protein U1B84_35680 [Variovorax sp.]|nr:hypothetical protein [Variovorax sp.]
MNFMVAFVMDFAYRDPVKIKAGVARRSRKKGKRRSVNREQHGIDGFHDKEIGRGSLRGLLCSHCEQSSPETQAGGPGI